MYLDKKVCAVIVAAGKGRRMGFDKMLYKIDGVAVVEKSIMAFQNNPLVDSIVVVAGDNIEDIKELASKHSKVKAVVMGGAERAESVANGLKETEAGCLVAVHDGARPFVTAETIGENIALMADYDCVTTAVPAIDTILVSENGADVQAIPDRKTMFAVQTPQTFRVTELIAAIDSLTEEEKSSLTDGAKIYLLKGRSVGIAKGGAENIKITEPKDIAIGEAILNQRK